MRKGWHQFGVSKHLHKPNTSRENQSLLIAFQRLYNVTESSILTQLRILSLLLGPGSG